MILENTHYFSVVICSKILVLVIISGNMSTIDEQDGGSQAELKLNYGIRYWGGEFMPSSFLCLKSTNNVLHRSSWFNKGQSCGM